MDDSVPFLLTIEYNAGAESLRTAARLQIVARKFGFKPVWLVGVRALNDPAVVEPLARWQRSGEAEIGGLLEAAAVPPLVDLGALPGDRAPALTDYPESVLEEKVTCFADALASAFDRRAVTLRCVQPAVDDRYYAALVKNGFKVDLTVAPHTKSPVGDFTGYSEKPYLTPQGVLEVPQTIRRRRYGPLVEDLLVLPGLAGRAARVLFPDLRVFRLSRKNRPVVRALALEGLKAGAALLDLRIGLGDWKRGEALVRDLERILATVQTRAAGLSAEEFLLRYKNELLRKGLA